jgi:site-specific DNA recombinase
MVEPRPPRDSHTRLEARAQNGEPHSGGRRAFGFEPDGATLRATEAVALQWAVDQLLAGDSLKQVCRRLAEQGIVTPSGQPWAPSKLSRALRSPRVAGQRSHHGAVYPGTWPAIIEPEIQQRLIEVLDQRVVGHLSAPAKNLLSGLARCGAKGCGCGMWVRYKGSSFGGRRYACVAPPVGHGCGKVSVSADWLDGLIVESTIERLLSEGFAKALEANLVGDESRHGIAVRLEEDKQALTDLTRDRYVHRIVDHASFLDSKAVLDERIAETERLLERRPEAAALLDLPRTEAELRRALGAMPTEELRAVIGAALERVLIQPVAVRGRNRLDESRVDPRWRF